MAKRGIIIILTLLAVWYSWTHSKLCMDTVGYAAASYELQGQSIGESKNRAFSELKTMNEALFQHYTSSDERRVARYESLEVFENWMPLVRHKFLFIALGTLVSFLTGSIWSAYQWISVVSVGLTIALVLTLYEWSWREMILVVVSILFSLYFSQVGRFQTPDALCGLLFVGSAWCYVRGYYTWVLAIIPWMVLARMQFGIMGAFYWLVIWKHDKRLVIVSAVASVIAVIGIQTIAQPYGWWLNYCNMLDGGIQAYPLEHVRPFSLGLIFNTTIDLIESWIDEPTYFVMMAITLFGVRFYSWKSTEFFFTTMCAVFLFSHLILMPLSEHRYFTVAVLTIFVIFIKSLRRLPCDI